MQTIKVLDCVVWANILCFIACHFGKWLKLPYVIDVCIWVTIVALLAVALCMLRPKWLSGEPVGLRRILWRGIVCVCMLVLFVVGRAYWL